MGRADIGSIAQLAGGTALTRRTGEPPGRVLSKPPERVRAGIDVELMEGIRLGDAPALSALYDRHARIVISLAQRILGDREGAEEVLQEVFFRVWRRADAYRPDRGEPVSWLLSMTHNLAIDEMRKRQRRPSRADSASQDVLLAGIVDGRPAVEEEAWRRVLRGTLAGALASLPLAQREAISLVYLNGLTQREVAAALGAPLGTIKTRLRLGLDKLRATLELEGLAGAA